MTRKTIFFQNLGCPKNLVDTETMLGMSKEAGYVVVSEPKHANIIVINTCCFIEEATKESINTILELLQFKLKGSCEKLIVTGCLAQKYSKALIKHIPEIDVLVGTGEYSNFPLFLTRNVNKHKIFLPPGFINEGKYPRINSEPFFRAYLKISDGCRKRCSFCVIPKIRGPLISRSINSIKKEAQILAKKGVKELTLVAQSLGDYGKDLNNTNLSKLLHTLIRIGDLKWIRLLYIYPEDFNEELLEVFKENKICKYIDMPIQHASDRLLKLMNRKTRKFEILKRIENLREKIPDISIRTSLIVGYPSETKKDFNELMDFIKDVEFDHLGAFIFSRNEGTRAYHQKKQINFKEKKERFLRIMELQKNISRKKLRLKVNKTLNVLVESKNNNLFFGRHEGQAPEIDGKVIFKGNAKIGSFSNVYIEDSADYDLIGRKVS